MQDKQREGKIDCIPISCLDEMIILPSHKQLASHLSQLIFLPPPIPLQSKVKRLYNPSTIQRTPPCHQLHKRNVALMLKNHTYQTRENSVESFEAFV